jgi:hypothetical protein
MRTWILILSGAWATLAACDDALDLNPVPHDAGADAATAADASVDHDAASAPDAGEGGG